MEMEGILGEAEYHIGRPMPSTTAGDRPTLQHGGRKPSGQIPCQQHSGRYMAADTLWQIQNGGYTEVNIQRQIQQWIYNTTDTVVDIQ